MKPRKIWNEYRPLFDLRRRVQMRVVEVCADWMGLFLAGPYGDTILINLHHIDDEDDLRATILHELIHAEQRSRGLPTEHDEYFNNRRKEFDAFGLDI